VEPCGTLSYITLVVDISPSAETEFSMRKKRANKLDYTERKF
jgi:hypothetical protein